jgi:hypothetical protein
MKPSCLITLLLLMSLFAARLGMAENLRLEVEDLACKEGLYYLKGSIGNHYTYDRHLFIAYKIVKEETTLACATSDLTVRADSEEVQELTFPFPCDEEVSFTLNYKIYDRRDRVKATAWLSDCPD